MFLKLIKMYKCFLCNKFFDLELLLTHFKYLHMLTNGSDFKCAEDGCNQIFTVPFRFKKHLKKHKPSSFSSLNSNELPSLVDSGHKNNLESFSKKENSSEYQCNININEFESFIKNSAITFLCKLSAKSKVINSLIEEIVEDFTCDFFNDIIMKLGSIIEIAFCEKCKFRKEVFEI